MSARTYPFGYRSTAPGWPAEMLTAEQLMTKPAWARLHPEVRRRHLAIFDAAQDAGTMLGIGGGWRSAAQQEATFRSRYDTTPRPNAKSRVVWNGQTWYIKSNSLAPSTPPGRSWHEESPEVVDAGDWAYAVDTIGDWAFLAEHCAAYGLVEFSDVNDEPWHTQPVELPTARRNYSGQTLGVWSLPGLPVVIDPPVVVPPTPRPPAGGLELIAMYQIALTYAPGTLVCRVTADEIIHEVSANAAAVDERAGVIRVTVGWEEFVEMCRSRRTVGNPFTGDWYDKALADAWAAAQG